MNSPTFHLMGEVFSSETQSSDTAKGVKPLRVLVVGCGHMGKSHARAYHSSPSFEIVGLVSRHDGSREKLNNQLKALPRNGVHWPKENPGYALFDQYAEALKATKPDIVSINTYPDTHAEYARMAFAAGAHVFVEKPLAETVIEAEGVVAAAIAANRKLVVGYILHHHPGFQRFVAIGRELGKPLVMRMNLNQQSAGREWETHKQLMRSCSPIVDCGVHYVDLMCQATGARPVSVHAIGARLSQDIDAAMYNYGHLHIVFSDGSVGWYEAGWGPMMSQEAHFIKDIIGPKGSITMKQVSRERREDRPAEAGQSSDIDSHTKMQTLLRHASTLNPKGQFAEEDSWVEDVGEPTHQHLCEAERDYLLNAIQSDLDLTEHHRSALDSLRIVLAADESVRSGEVVRIA